MELMQPCLKFLRLSTFHQSAKAHEALVQLVLQINRPP